MAAAGRGSGGAAAPPAPVRVAALAARALAFAITALVAWWVAARLGGVAAAPEPGGKTGRLFNWHPVLMTLAFVVFMSEALLAYRAPWQPGAPRPHRKALHVACHCLSLVCVAGGLSAVWRSHDLADPPMANLYSPHSFLGMAAVCLLGLQFTVGFYSYLWPKASLAVREALGPTHRFLGGAAYCAGLAAAASGLQEKAGFLQTLGSKPVYSSFIRAPAWAAALLPALAMCVLWPLAGGFGGGGGAHPHQPLPSHDGDEERAPGAAAL